MKVALYKGKRRIFSRLVSWWTRGKYSHVELILDDGISVSSSFMDGGVRYKRIHYTSNNWDFIDIGPETPCIRERIQAMHGQKYDIRGLAGFVIRSVEDSRNKVFCSEFLMRVIGYDEAWRFSPNTAAVILKRRECE